MSLVDVIRDPVWQFVGVVLGLLALVATVAISLRQRQRKRLSYLIVKDARVLSPRDELTGRLQFLLDSRPIETLDIVFIDIMNPGNVPISGADVEQPLWFDFGKNAQVLSSEIVDTKPAGIEASAVATRGLVTLKTGLLNPGDTVSIRVLLTGKRGALSSGGRVLGVAAIEPKVRSRMRLTPLGIGIVMAMAALAAFEACSLGGMPRGPAIVVGIGFGLWTVGSLMGKLGLTGRSP